MQGLGQGDSAGDCQIFVPPFVELFLSRGVLHAAEAQLDKMYKDPQATVVCEEKTATVSSRIAWKSLLEILVSFRSSTLCARAGGPLWHLQGRNNW